MTGFEPLPGGFRFVDLFAGIGGLHEAMRQAGGRCVLALDKDRFAALTYRANFPDTRHVTEDIRAIHVRDIPPHDVLVAGFPCQPFSSAGVSVRNALHRPHGCADKTSGTLVFEVLRILGHHRPPAFLLENVKNLKTHDRGRTFAVIQDRLTRDLGYTLHARIIDAAPWLPQHRERLVMVGFRNPTTFSFADMVPPERVPSLRDILHPEDGTEPPDPPYTLLPLVAVNPKYTLSDRLWQSLQAHAARHRAKGNGFGCSLVRPDGIARTPSARYHKDGSEILVPRTGGRTAAA